MKVDLKNLPILIMRLQIQLNSNGMELDTEKFKEMVSKNNDVGSVIKQCGEMLYGGNSETSGLVTLTPEYSKGSVDAARGEKLSLAPKPKLEHKNTVVRGVKQSLSARGIMIESDSDSSNCDSDYSNDEEARRLFGLSSRETVPKPRSRLHRDLRQEHEDTKVAKLSPDKSHTNTSKKFKAAALNAMMMRSRGTKASSKDAASQEGSKTSRSLGSKDTGSKKKLTRSLTMDTNQSSRSSSRGNGPTRRVTVDGIPSEDAGITVSRGSSRGKKPAKLSRANTMDGSAPRSRKIQDDEFSTGSSRKARAEVKNKPGKLRRSKTDMSSGSSVGSHGSIGSKGQGKHARGSSIGSQGSKESSGRTATVKRQGSAPRSSKKSEDVGLSKDSSPRRRRVREGSF